jgi:lactoylglutathione lyase
MIKFGYSITYVDSVEETILFFENAFDIKRRFVHEGGDYGELETGETVLAFASHQLGEVNLPDGYINASTSTKPLGTEIALVTENVAGAHKSAVDNGATELKAPQEKPWGQTVSYVRCPSGLLLELCSPM